MTRAAWITALVLLAPLASGAEVFSGKVVRVTDGDTLTLLVQREQIKVFRRWMRDETLLDDEAQARESRAGLWGLPEAERIAPWEWRDAARELRR